MNLEKAIEIKQHYQYILQDASSPELIEADNLSIEALKRCRRLRSDKHCSPIKLLPSETED
ncbi:hypothetical protein ES703_70947 [subsurface metagenome]